MRIVVSELLSLDGVMEDPGGADGFEHGGWTVRWHNQEIEHDQRDPLVAADALDWANSHLLAGDVVDAVTGLKRRAGRDLLVSGSATLVRDLARHDLVDLYRFTVHPVVLGTGTRIFGGDRVDLQLVGQRPTSTGATSITLRPASTRQATAAA